MKQYKVYLLDFDGTIADSLESIVEPYVEGFKRVGVTLQKEDVEDAIHHSVGQTLEKHHVSNPDEIRKFLETFFYYFETDENIKKVKIFAEVPSFLEKGKGKGIIFGVVSGNAVSHIKHVLTLFGLDKYFSFYVGGEANRKPKPYPDPLYAAFEYVKDVSKKDIVYVGDSLQDIECAKNAGIDGILVERKGEYPKIDAIKIRTLDELFL